MKGYEFIKDPEETCYPLFTIFMENEGLIIPELVCLLRLFKCQRVQCYSSDVSDLNFVCRSVHYSGQVER